MESGPLVSVIVPIYNGEKYLRRCVESILSQTYQPMEILLSDDGSTDHSGEICDEYAQLYPQVKVIHEKNGGVSKARNRALEIASGDYVAFVDVDDVLANDQVIFSCMELSKECHPDLLFWNCKEFLDGQAVPAVQEMRREQAKWVTKKGEVEKYATATTIWSFLFSKKVLDGQRFNEKYSLGEDTLFLAQVLLNADTLIDTNGIGYERCLRAGSLVHSGYKQGDVEKIYELHGELKHLFGEEKGRKQIYESIVIAHYTSVIQKIRRSKEKGLIRELRKRIWKTFPSFLGNPLLHASTKLLVFSFAVSPGFYVLVYDGILKRGERYQNE